MSLNKDKKYDFTGKVALVTGSSTGIGEAIAVQFAQYGAKVIITGRDSEKLENVTKRIKQLSGGGEVLAIVGDFVADSSLPQKLITESVAKFGRLDFLVNNAGQATTMGSLANKDLLQGFDSVFRLNVRSVVELTQLAVPYLEKTKGNIINISSVVSLRPYTSTVPRKLPSTWSPKLVHSSSVQKSVNSINPGPVVTEYLRSVGLDQKAQQHQFYEDMIAKSPIKVVGQPEDISNLASFLASDDERNITGSIFVSDSGYLLV